MCVVFKSFCIPRTAYTYIGLVGGLRWVGIKKKNCFSSYTHSIKLINQIKPLYVAAKSFCEHDNNLINIVKLSDISTYNQYAYSTVYKYKKIII